VPIGNSGLFAQSPQWGNLAVGAHAVGFRLLETWDRGRAERPSIAFNGRRDTSTYGVPMQIGYWYPAQRPLKARPMSYFDLAVATLNRERFGRLGTTDSVAARREVTQIVRIGGGDTAQLALHVSRTLAQPTASFLHATPASGRFPVAIIAAGGWLGSSTVLAEYLASHGWIVIATTGQTRQSGAWQVSQSALAIETGVQAIEFAIARAQEFRGADVSRLALIGVNFDSFSALEYQMRYMRAAAVVTINGWETIEERAAVLRSSPWYEATRLRVPLLNVHWDERQSAPANFAFLDSLKYSERRSLTIEGLDHFGLVLNPLSIASAGARRHEGYQFLIRAVHSTLERAVGGSNDRFLERTPTDVGFPAVNVTEHWHRAALPAVPTRAEFFAIIAEQMDVATAVRLFREARARDSTVSLFNEADINLASFRLQRSQRMDDAIAVQQLAAEAYPASHLARNSLGNTRLAAADTVGALREFDLALELLEKSPLLSAADKETLRGLWRAKVTRLRRTP
jgi:tetratricopeptide (TPR) repeat protein